MFLNPAPQICRWLQVVKFAPVCLHKIFQSLAHGINFYVLICRTTFFSPSKTAFLKYFLIYLISVLFPRDHILRADKVITLLYIRQAATSSLPLPALPCIVSLHRLQLPHSGYYLIDHLLIPPSPTCV